MDSFVVQFISNRLKRLGPARVENRYRDSACKTFTWICRHGSSGQITRLNHKSISFFIFTLLHVGHNPTQNSTSYVVLAKMPSASWKYEIKLIRLNPSPKT